MDLERIRQYCLQKPGTSEDCPFDEDTLVFRVENKIFLLTSLTHPTTINLKCDPVHAMELRERYEAVQPGYHMNKKHWNTVAVNAGISDGEILAMIDESYALVFRGLKKPVREKLKSEGGVRMREIS